MNLRSLVRKVLRRPAAGCQGSSQSQESRKKLADVGAKFHDDGKIEVDGVWFHQSYPTFESVLVENVYNENYAFTMEGDWVMFDVGANAGAASLWMARSPHIKKVYAFEPVTPTYEMLRRNVALNPFLSDKIGLFPVGLGSRRESLQIAYHPDHAMSVSSKHTFDTCFTPTSHETVKIENAAGLLAPLLARHLDERAFLKVDCEGAEYDIIPELARAGLLSKFQVAIIEWHGGNHWTLVELLREHGFFSFIEWHRRDFWKLGLVKAVKT